MDAHGNTIRDGCRSINPYLAALRLSWNYHKDRDRVRDWPRCDNHRKKLAVSCKSSKMLQLARTHVSLVKKKDFRGNDDATRAHLKELGGFLRLLWLKRDAEDSEFFGHPPTEVPRHRHFPVTCRLREDLLEMVNNSIQKSTAEAEATDAKKLREWERVKRKVEPKPTITVPDWLI